jgi:F-type H+-transporting ATPase subunit b
MDNPLLQPDPGLFVWTILTFLFLLTLLVKFAWRPLLDALETRQQGIRQALDDAQKAKQELERLEQESAQIIRKARAEAESIIAESRSDAERLRGELREKARAEADGIVRNAQRQIQLETARAVQQIRTEAVDLSVQIASKIIQRNLSADDNARLIAAGRRTPTFTSPAVPLGGTRYETISSAASRSAR